MSTIIELMFQGTIVYNFYILKKFKNLLVARQCNIPKNVFLVFPNARPGPDTNIFIKLPNGLETLPESRIEDLFEPLYLHSYSNPPMKLYSVKWAGLSFVLIYSQMEQGQEYQLAGGSFLRDGDILPVSVNPSEIVPVQALEILRVKGGRLL